jgi:hypothetical protein
MSKLFFWAALAAILTPSLASAFGPGNDQYGFRKRHAARAAPWFLYWPYDNYWQTPAPTGYGYIPNHPMTSGPYMGQIGPAAGFPRVMVNGPTGYDY